MAQTKEGALKLAAKNAGVSVEDYISKREQRQKHCYKCRTWHDYSKFNNDRSRSDGLSALCMACRTVPPNERKCWKGRVSTFKGKRHTDDAKAKMSQAKQGRTSPKKGVPRTDEEKAAIQKGSRASKHKYSGPNHYNWKGGITPLNSALRKGTFYQ